VGGLASRGSTPWYSNSLVKFKGLRQAGGYCTVFEREIRTSLVLGWTDRKRRADEKAMFYRQSLPDEPEVKGDEPGVQSHLPASSFEPRLWRYLCFGFLLFALSVVCVSAVVGYITGRPLVLLYMVIASMVVAAVNYRSLVTSVSVLSINVNATSISGPGEVPIYSGSRSSRTSARQTILLA
jgi:hypothetical protein